MLFDQFEEEKVFKKLLIFSLFGFYVFSARGVSASPEVTGPTPPVGTPCELVIYDEVGALDGKWFVVESAVRALEARGAEVRVAIFESLRGADTLDALKASWQKRCGRWRAVNGGMKNNLVIFMMTMRDKKLALFYGDLLKSELDATARAILSQKVRPKFGDGDFAGGIAAGLTAAAAAITPSSGSANTLPPSGGTSTGSSVMLWILGGLLVTGLLVFAVILILRSRKREEERQIARRKAIKQRAYCETFVVDLYGMVEDMEKTIKGFEVQVSEGDCRHLEALLEEARREFDEAVARKSEAGHAEENPEKTDLTTAQYREIELTFQKVHKELEDARKCRSKFDEAVRKLNDLIEDTETDSALTAGQLVVSREALEELFHKGYFLVQELESMEEAEAAFQDAEEAFENRQFLRGEKLRMKAMNIAETLGKFAERLPKQRKLLESEADKLEKMIGDAEEKIRESRKNFVVMVAKYAESSWEVVRGNGTEAEKHLAVAREDLKQMREAFSMEKQEWPSAEQHQEAVQRQLERVDELVTAIDRLLLQLQEAEKHAASEVRDAEIDIKFAQRYIANHDADIREELEHQLEDAAQSLQEAKEQMALPKPDYIMVVKLAKQANASADRILKEARSEVDKAERLRRKANTAVREASRSLETTRHFVAIHPTSVTWADRENLEKAQAALELALESVDVGTRIASAESADRLADDVLHRAQKSFRRGQEQMRRRASVRRGNSLETGWRQNYGDYDGYPESSRTPPSPPPAPIPPNSDGGGVSMRWGANSDGSGTETGW